MNLNIHDFIVALAEDCGLSDALRTAGYQPQSLRTVLVRARAVFGIEAQGETDATVEAIRTAAKAAGYQNHVYNFMHEEDRQFRSEACCANV